MLHAIKCKFIVIFLLAGLAVAQSGDIDEAKKLLDVLYKSTIISDKNLDYGNKEATSKYFSSDMAEWLFLEDKCTRETREICNIDWVILCSCQDYGDKGEFSVNFETKSIRPMQIIAKIKIVNWETKIQFNFIKENGKLKISDIIDEHGHSLKETLRLIYGS